MDMPITEVFPSPTVKQVIFEIKFPNLFYIEKKIGDYQVKIMKEFPKSALLFRRRILFADIGPRTKLEEVSPKLDEEQGKKIWEFKSDEGYRISVSSNFLQMLSERHKTYDLGDKDKFRDVIKFALDNFFEVVQIPFLNRVGLRYVDECPLPTKDNETFKSYYDSVFPIDRFSIADADEMFFRTVIRRGDFFLTYMESLQKSEDKYKLILDFDGFARDISYDSCLEVTDELHSMISDEYERTIKEPVYEYMRQVRIE